MENFVLECCVDSLTSAINANEAGATRLELCSNLIIGGTTPDICFFNYVKSKVNIPINVLIRPRFGDFLYSDYEIDIMAEQIEMFKENKANGVVIGALDKNGYLDEGKMEKLLSRAKGMEVTLHRAFDMTKDPIKTLELAKAMKINSILTSGQENSALEGSSLIKELVNKSKGEINILVGAKINSENIEKIHNETKATNFHLSAKIVENSKMVYRNEKVSMGLPGFSEYETWVTSKEEVIKARKVLESI